MLPTDLASLGGPHVDTKPLADPQGQVSAALYDRALENGAQMTRTIPKARVWFAAIAGGAADLPAASVSHASLWGNGSAQKPVVHKLGAGVYTITYAVSFTDALGVVEAVNFNTGHVEAFTSNSGDSVRGRLLMVSANVAWVMLESPITSPATCTDTGSISAELIKACAELF